MPLTGKYTWEETVDSVILTIPLKGAQRKDVDVYVSHVFIKVNYPPYLLQVDLADEVDDYQAVARFEGGTSLVLSVKKAAGARRLWKTLTVDGLDKKALIARRKASVDARSERDAALRKKKGEKAVDDERLALKKHMAMEESTRRELEDAKAEEKSAAENEVYKRLAEVQREAEEAEARAKAKAKRKAARVEAGEVERALLGHGDEDLTDGEEDEEGAAKAEAPPPEPLYESEAARKRAEAAEAAAEAMLADEGAGGAGAGAGASGAAAPVKADIFVDEATGEVDGADTDDEEGDEDDEDVEYVPPPRQTVKTTIAFTERVFPTPARESQFHQEEAWVEKNRKGLEARGRLKPRDPEARDISERDPVWLKGRGDDFFRHGDYRSAVNAYTAAIEADAALLSCISNRAVCHLKLGDLPACVEDCNLALAALPTPPAPAPGEGRDAGGAPPSPEEELVAKAAAEEWRKASEKDRMMVIKLLVRRGTALCQSGAYAESLLDFEAASRARPGDVLLAADVERVHRLVAVSEVKALGDAAFREGRVDEAVGKWTEALGVEPNFVSCISNRAAAYLSTLRFADCVEDCTSALMLLDPDEEKKAAAGAGAGEGDGEGEGEVGAGAGSGAGAGAGAGALDDAQAAARPVGPIPPPGSSKHRDWVLRTLVRRGTALVRMDRLPEAASDYRRAVKLDPENEGIAKDLRRIEGRILKAKTAAAAAAGGEAGAGAADTAVPEAARAVPPPQPPASATAGADASATAISAGGDKGYTLKEVRAEDDLEAVE